MNYENRKMPAVYPVTSHTNFVGKGSVFVAITGMQDDGNQYILDALEKGASAIVVQENAQLDDSTLLKMKECNARLVRVANTRRALSQLAAEGLDNPAKKMKIAGVTGTKGKHQLVS